jgi:hypothetical protein
VTFWPAAARTRPLIEVPMSTVSASSWMLTPGPSDCARGRSGQNRSSGRLTTLTGARTSTAVPRVRDGLATKKYTVCSLDGGSPVGISTVISWRPSVAGS